MVTVFALIIALAFIILIATRPKPWKTYTGWDYGADGKTTSVTITEDPKTGNLWVINEKQW